MSFQRRASAFDLARRAGARYVGVNGADSAGLEEYMASGTYTPTVTTNGSALVEPGPSGYSRVGNGAGVPQAGDTVTVFGAFSADGLADGDFVFVSLPFQIAYNAFPWCAAVAVPVEGVIGIVVNGTSYSAPDGAFAFEMAASEPGGAGVVSFTFTYQTENAVDP